MLAPRAHATSLPRIDLMTSVGTPSDSSGADSLSTITTDTGAFAPGNTDFSRFMVPGECVAAAKQFSAVLRRSLSVQYYLTSLRDTAPELDTLPQQAVAVARRCGAHFTIAKTAPRDLSALFTLALLEGDDSVARAVVQRQLVLAVDAKARQTVLAEAVTGYLAAEPARLTAAEWAAATADTLALAEHTNSLPAHMPFLEVARRGFDRPRMVQEAHRVIALGHVLPFSAIQYEDVPIIAAWVNILGAAFYDQPDSVLALAQKAKADLSRFPPGHEFPSGISYIGSQLFDFKHKTITQVRDFLLPFNPDKYTGSHALAAVNAQYWFPARPPAWPPRDHVSLVLYGGWIMSCARGDWALLLVGNSKECAPLHTDLRKWTERFDSLGFALTLVERSHGYAVRSIPLSPAAEADSLNWYYRTYLKLQATVAVVPQTIVHHIPEPDGRRWYADTTALGKTIGPVESNHGLAMLFGRDGTLLYAGDFDPALLHALIVRALASPATARGDTPRSDSVPTLPSPHKS